MRRVTLILVMISLFCAGVGASICIVEAVFDILRTAWQILTDFAWIKKWGYHEKLTRF